PEAIRKMTSLAASQMKIPDRGRLAEGYFADVVIFDPKTVADTATFEQPHQYPVGIDTVIVNGMVTVSHGTHTGAHAGPALYGPGLQEQVSSFRTCGRRNSRFGWWTHLLSLIASGIPSPH